MKRYLLIFMLLLIAGCGDDSPSGSSRSPEPELTITEGQFTLKVPDFSSVSETLIYEWPNSSDIAVVEQNGRIPWGRAILTVGDGVGEIVYTGDLDEEGAYLTDLGTPGSWTIQIDLQNASGTIDLIITSE